MPNEEKQPPGRRMRFVGKKAHISLNSADWRKLG